MISISFNFIPYHFFYMLPKNGSNDIQNLIKITSFLQPNKIDRPTTTAIIYCGGISAEETPIFQT